jgi:hypothetical protein
MSNFSLKASCRWTQIMCPCPPQIPNPRNNHAQAPRRLSLKKIHSKAQLARLPVPCLEEKIQTNMTSRTLWAHKLKGRMKRTALHEKNHVNVWSAAQRPKQSEPHASLSVQHRIARRTTKKGCTAARRAQQHCNGQPWDRSRQNGRGGPSMHSHGQTAQKNPSVYNRYIYNESKNYFNDDIFWKEQCITGEL